jgi:predicted deacylase
MPGDVTRSRRPLGVVSAPGPRPADLGRAPGAKPAPAAEAPRPDLRYVAGASSVVRGRGAPVGPGMAPLVVPKGARLLPPNDFPALMAKVDALRADPRVEVGELGVVGGCSVPVLRLTGPGPRLKVLITAGVHGNEPCGPAAAMLFVEQLLADAKALAGLDVTVIPAVNPRAYIANTRRVPEDIDLNRVFGAEDAPAEAKNLVRYLTGRRYDLGLDLHSGSAKKRGFWTLHRGARDLLVPAMGRFAERWPVLRKDTKSYTITDPGVGTSTNRSTLKDFVHDQGTPRTVTLEAPGSLDYTQMVLGENQMVHHILAELRAQAARGAAAVS